MTLNSKNMKLSVESYLTIMEHFHFVCKLTFEEAKIILFSRPELPSSEMISKIFLLGVINVFWQSHYYDR